MNKLEVAVTQQNGIIKMNFEELKEKLRKTLAIYEGTEVTADTTIEAKKDLAELRKVKTSLNSRRIEVKKEFLKPYDDFEKNVNELQGMIDKPIEMIDDQLKVFEKKRKAEKKKEIEGIYKELINDLEEYLPLTKIYNSKWENVSVSIKSVTEEIELAISSTDMAVATIKGMNSEVVDKALEQYKVDLSLANAIAYINKHEQLKAEILAKEEQKRKEEEERKRIAEEKRLKEQERLRVIEEERKKREEEQRIKDAERQRIETEEKIRQEEREKARKIFLESNRNEGQTPVADGIMEQPFEIDALEEPFKNDDSDLVDVEKPFGLEDLEIPFEIDSSPFLQEGEVKALFTVVGTSKDLRELEIILDSLGLFYERMDA